MPSVLSERCAWRSAQTGENHQQALGALRQLGRGTPPVPDAVNSDQAFLEACFLERLGQCDQDRWRPFMLPFAIKSVTPLPDELVLRIPAEFLPDVLREVLPGWPAEGNEPDTPEVYGIPGLRPRYEGGRGVLTRPGFPGRVSIPASRDQWRKAGLVAADLNGGLEHYRMPWLTSPADWHPAETRFTRAWPRRFSPDGEDSRNSPFGSRILRRLPGLCPTPRAVFHSLWINRFGGTCAIQFEWENGPSCADVLKRLRLLDAEFRPGAELESPVGEAAGEDCHSAFQGRIKVVSADNPGCTIVLRHLTAKSADTDTRMSRFLRAGLARRAAIEDRHGYRPHVRRRDRREDADAGRGAWD